MVSGSGVSYIVVIVTSSCSLLINIYQENPYICVCQTSISLVKSKRLKQSVHLLQLLQSVHQWWLWEARGEKSVGGRGLIMSCEVLVLVGWEASPSLPGGSVVAPGWGRSWGCKLLTWSLPDWDEARVESHNWITQTNQIIQTFFSQFFQIKVVLGTFVLIFKILILKNNPLASPFLPVRYEIKSKKSFSSWILFLFLENVRAVVGLCWSVKARRIHCRGLCQPSRREGRLSIKIFTSKYWLIPQSLVPTLNAHSTFHEK